MRRQQQRVQMQQMVMRILDSGTMGGPRPYRLTPENDYSPQAQHSPPSTASCLHTRTSSTAAATSRACDPATCTGVQHGAGWAGADTYGPLADNHTGRPALHNPQPRGRQHLPMRQRLCPVRQRRRRRGDIAFIGVQRPTQPSCGQSSGHAWSGDTPATPTSLQRATRLRHVRTQ